MFVTINGCRLNVEVLGADDAPVLIAHHGGGGIGSLAEPKSTFGPLADQFRVVVFDARGCGQSEGIPPYSHAQWAADVDGLREWLGAEQIVVAGGSYGGFIAMEYAIAYPERTRAMILRDTSADSSNLDRAYENARNQDRVEINWANFDRYWKGQITDNEDLKARWAEIIPLYDFEYDPVASAARVEAGSYRYEAHNYCFTHNMPAYDLKPKLPSVTCPTLVTVGRADWVTPVSSARGDRGPDPRGPAGRVREVRALTAVRGGRAVPAGHARFPGRGDGLMGIGDDFRAQRRPAEGLHLDSAACGRSAVSVLDAVNAHLELEARPAGTSRRSGPRRR